MSTLKVDGIRSNSATSDAITLADNGTCTANITNNLSNRNLIINGAVAISQRNGTSNTTIASGATYGPDRIAARTQTGSGHTLAQTEDGPDGFKYSAKVTIGTGGSPSAANKNYLYQTIEGNNVAHLGSGTSSAETVTLSFWVKSSLTGNFGAAIVSGAADYSYTFPYTISSANTWEKKTKTIALPTSGGTWATNNSSGLMVMFDLGSGSDYEGTANQWNSAFDVRASSDVKLMATNSATWYVTGLQLEVGVGTDFEHRSYAQELALAQRYYQQVYFYWNTGSTSNNFLYYVGGQFNPIMRAAPSLVAAYDNNNENSFETRDGSTWRTGLPSLISASPEGIVLRSNNNVVFNAIKGIAHFAAEL
tara:strand:+ start:151 stop:1242 length:1092 start_codon:yes stop_codon:yes gene_type:complete